VTDLTLTRSGEFAVVSIQAETEEGTAFLDSWNQTNPDWTVVDSGWIIVRNAKALRSAAERAGLTITEAKAL
jgi:hypothetical protein